MEMGNVFNCKIKRLDQTTIFDNHQTVTVHQIFPVSDRKTLHHVCLGMDILFNERKRKLNAKHYDKAKIVHKFCKAELMFGLVES